MPGVAFALATVSASLLLEPDTSPTVILDVSTVLAELNVQLLERLLRFALAIRHIQIAEELFTGETLILPEVIATEAQPVRLPSVNFSLWVHDVAVFVAGDVSDLRPVAPLLKLSVPLCGLQLAKQSPHVSVKLHDLALRHIGEPERGTML